MTDSLTEMTAQEKAKDKRLRDVFNSSLEAYLTKMLDQGNCCAICGRPFIKGASVGIGTFKKEIYTAFQDHFHGCCPRRLKKFCGACSRGLLCFVCNRFVVGIIEKHNIPIDRLAAYMAKWAHIPSRAQVKLPRAKAKRKKKKK
jgi:hypothetical protein